MSTSREILRQDIWHVDNDVEEPASPEVISLHYARARSICKNAVIAARDMTAFIIAAIQVNLCIGTLSPFVEHRPDLRDLLEKLLNFDVCGQFMLTEVGHGLDARNLETKATLQPDGSFDLHTPNGSAAKAMPPTTPLCGMPRVAIVFARLVVDERYHGVKPFLVSLSDSGKMTPGIISRILPTRPGTKPLDHSMTTFKHVRLPPGALLGSIEKPKDERAEFLRQIWRVPIGTLSLSIMGISAIKVGTYVAATYSQRRTITGPDGMSRTPIMEFCTQQRPIVKGWVQSIVLDKYARWAVREFMNTSHQPLTRHALAVIFKSMVVEASPTLNELAERCGWQGLFAFNQISQLALTFQGNIIAEGDTLVLCIRFVSELLGERFRLPAPHDPETVLARREYHMMAALKAKLTDIGGYVEHRSSAFNRHILPYCRPMVEAIGHRMVYDSAMEAGVCPKVLRLYERVCVGMDLSQHSTDGLNLRALMDADVRLYEDVLADALRSVNHSDAEAYATAPIMSDRLWEAFFDKLQAFGNHGDLDFQIQPKL
ncbi:hypothetical protein FDECE_3474 [Fusarium decemcellulare]|nr:hypothetical protein FDECE_3474 [Fusarium decemcellulare]